VEVDVDSAFGGRQCDHPTRLRGAHRGVRVLVGEHALDRDDVRAVRVHPVVDRVADGQQSLVQRGVGRCADHVDVERDDLPALPAFDHGEPAARQPGIDSHYAHANHLL
jgi:hypothetical protein